MIILALISVAIASFLLGYRIGWRFSARVIAMAMMSVLGEASTRRVARYLMEGEEGDS